jgi:hypothetical protein
VQSAGTKEERAEADLLAVEQAPDDPAQAVVVAAASEAAQHAEADAQPPWLVDVEHDRETRKRMIAQMVADRHVYSDEEDSIIQRGLAMLEADSAQVGKVRQFKHGPTIDSSWTKLDKGSGLLVGNTQCVIRGAGPLDIIAYLMDLHGMHFRSTLDPETDVRDELREVRNSHHIVEFYEGKAAPFQNRTILSTLMWKQLSDAQFVWCLSPIADHPTLTASDERDAVRAEGARVLRLTMIAQNVTRVEYACTLDLKGSFPAWLTDKVALPGLMHECARPAVATPRCQSD